MTDREKDVEILALRHQLTILQRQLGNQRPRLRPEDRMFLAALLVPLSCGVLRRLRLLVNPDTVLRWHRDLAKHRHARASVNGGPGRPRLSPRSVASSSVWQPRTPHGAYRRIHGELALLGVKVAASTVWEILKTDGVDPAPQRANVRWADFLRSQAEAILAMDFIETVTLTGRRQYILAAVHHTAGGSALSVPPRTPPMPGLRKLSAICSWTWRMPGTSRRSGTSSATAMPSTPH